jgi:transcriptional regulator with XRE-family HTH domain
MKIFKAEGTPPAATSGAASTTVLRVVSLPTQAQTKGASMPEQDGLDRLVARLSARSGSFAKKLGEAQHAVAPLALDDDGKATLLYLRMHAKLTQTQFAQAIGQRQSNVSLMETGQRVNLKRETMQRMCEVLGCDMNTLDSALTASENRYQRYLDGRNTKDFSDAGTGEEMRTA